MRSPSRLTHLKAIALPAWSGVVVGRTVPPYGGRKVEAPVRIAVPVLSGLAGLTAAITGAYIRSCAMPAASLYSAWCGKPPVDALQATTQAHCAGCALLVTGLAAVAASGLAAIMAHRPRAMRRVKP